MIIHLSKDNINSINLNVNNLVIGFFDGLHKGHKKLFKDLSGSISVLTFINIPKKSEFLYPFEDRIEQLKKHFNVEHIFVFNVMELNMTAKEFIDFFLVKLQPNQIIVGSDFKFGSDQQCYQLLQNEFNLKIVERDVDYSSTNIRKLIKESRFDEANFQLLEPYYRSGKVIHSHKISRKIGFPTANIQNDESLIKLEDGVYISKTRLNDKEYLSTSFIGIPKTFENLTKPSFESYLIGYEGIEFYNQRIDIIFYKRIADVKKYNSINDLIEGIKSQVQETKEFFKK